MFVLSLDGSIGKLTITQDIIINLALTYFFFVSVSVFVGITGVSGYLI